MSTEKYFSIIVDGRLSSEAEEGNLDKNSGLPDGPTTKIKLQVGGTAIPNFSKVWAKKIIDKTTKTYQGQLEFLPWGTEGGESVQIRYLEGINTLDKVYQTTVLKLTFSEEETNANAYISLDIGVNDFNVDETDPMFIEMLKHHTYNGDNPSRNKTSKEIHFHIYDPKKMNGNKVDQMRKDKLAQDIILSAENDSARLAILAGMFELDPRSQDAVLFNELLEILEDDKKRVLDVVDFQKNRFEFLLKKLEDAGDLAYSGQDLVLTIDHDRDVLLNDFEVKNWILHLKDNLLDPDIFAVYQKVLEVDKQLTEQLN